MLVLKKTSIFNIKTMVLILSNNNDMSTTQVINWLEVNEKKWLRVNTEDKVCLNFIGDDVVFLLNSKTYNLSDFSSFWYRRGFLNFDFENIKSELFNKFQKIELNDFIGFLYYKISLLPHINNISNASVNKLIVSDLARKMGVKTPNDYIFSNLESLNKKLNPDKEYITKSISGDSTILFENFIIYNYSSILNKEEIKSENFFPSLVQNYIHKKYELRIFYLVGSFYTMAIMSQNDKQTVVDFRVYNDEKPNRNVPFQLPKEIEIKLDKLMQKLNLNSGSIDMIVTSENDYVFLEVNPVGQFGMTSYPCNYNLEKKIAEYLVNNNMQQTKNL
jgi:ATP-GRASP peptide maturase of grasp-with-spasm system